MIQISVETLMGCTDALNELIRKPLKIHTAYKIARLAREVQSELELFNATKQALISKYGEYDEDGNLVTINDTNYKIRNDQKDAFMDELQNLMAQTIELNIEPITLKELEGEMFTPQEVNSIIDFIEE